MRRFRLWFRCFRGTFTTERGRFVWVCVLWAIALFSAGIWTAILIGLLGLLAYWEAFVEFVNSALKNEWPYNLLGALGAVSIYSLTGLSSKLTSQVITSITGFNSEQFPGAYAILSACFMLTGLFVSFTIIAGFGAIATGFSSHASTRTAPVAFMIALPALIICFGWKGSDQSTIALLEKVIITTSFHDNSSFERGGYVATDGVRYFGTKICQNLPFDALVAPNSNTGYITAIPRATPAALRAPKDGMNSAVLATAYVYGYVKQDDCPKIQEYIEELKVQVPKPNQ